MTSKKKSVLPLGACKPEHYLLGRFRWFRRMKQGHWIAQGNRWYLLVPIEQKTYAEVIEDDINARADILEMKNLPR